MGSWHVQVGCATRVVAPHTVMNGDCLLLDQQLLEVQRHRSVVGRVSGREGKHGPDLVRLDQLSQFSQGASSLLINLEGLDHWTVGGERVVNANGESLHHSVCATASEHNSPALGGEQIFRYRFDPGNECGVCASGQRCSSRRKRCVAC